MKDPEYFTPLSRRLPKMPGNKLRCLFTHSFKVCLLVLTSKTKSLNICVYGWESTLSVYISNLHQIQKQTKKLEHISFLAAVAWEQKKWKEINLTKSFV